MKTTSMQPRTLVLGIALALGVAAAGVGCTAGYDDADADTALTEPDADLGNDTLDAVTEDSVQPVSDTWITSKVMAELATIEGVDNTELGVETSNGVVTLTGVASSEATARQMAAAVLRVDGVTKVNTFGLKIGEILDNDVDVDNDGVNDDVGSAHGYAENDESMDAATQDSNQPASDTWVTTKVLAKLQTVDDLDNTDIAVETSNGIVTLSGRADSQVMIDAAVAAARTIEGVKDVDTSLLKIGSDADL